MAALRLARVWRSAKASPSFAISAGPLLFQVSENLLGVRQRLGDRLDLDQVVLSNGLPCCVVALISQTLETEPANGLDGSVKTLALRSAEKLKIGLPQGLHTAPVLDLQRLANQFVEFGANERLLTPRRGLQKIVDCTRHGAVPHGDIVVAGQEAAVARQVLPVALALAVEKHLAVRASVAAGLVVHDPPHILHGAEDAIHDVGVRPGSACHADAMLAACFGMRTENPATALV